MDQEESPLKCAESTNILKLKTSNIPKPQTPTKTRSIVTEEGYYSPSLETIPSSSRLKSPSRLLNGLDSKSYHKCDRNDLENLKSQVSTRKRDLQELKSIILGLRTHNQHLEVDKDDYEDTLALSLKAFKLKSNALDNLLRSKVEVKDEVNRKLELKLKELRIENDSAVYQTEKSYEMEIKKILAEKVSKIQSQKLKLKDRKSFLKKVIDEKDAFHEKHLGELKIRYQSKQSELEKSMMDIRSSLEKDMKELEMEKSKFESYSSISENQIQELNQEKRIRLENLDNFQELKSSKNSENTRLKKEIISLESGILDKQEKINNLQKDMEYKLQRTTWLKEEMMTEELSRRKLHNKLQELKGNIRVFCRIRPPIKSETEDTIEIQVPDNDEAEQEIKLNDPRVSSESLDSPHLLSNFRSKSHVFKFDRVFEMRSSNSVIFEEISQLVQSALDGFNICIFAYGQTGSGKTYTMSDNDGMIPRAIDQIFETSNNLISEGWEYKFIGEFLEIYNENINDLLGNPNNIDKAKYEIRHDPIALSTEVTGLTSVELTSPERMNEILDMASKNRSIAATNANERSSRSHSVFIIKIIGTNGKNAKTVKGCLNLIDLAGSERLSHSKATGDRLRETQHINKSLSCLGDVIQALGDGNTNRYNKEIKRHIPFRNSKLTYLLQNSLAGNSKTLMFVNISPSSKHFSETINSLRFATKVKNTKIEIAKKNTS
ncbi:hypothetical protein WICMUC_002693 [Wickerhamomyces mucosus]|uniref:Kinesin motor domain-containing protein n=1 Tax=Wickerhamomyces mucosus TaxID=1378264 RepID=A0A9P8PP61_9ASCO|nr:hypothetical protein WICMUC_002693 [Wickerhamomyces mucosus]